MGELFNRYPGEILQGQDITISNGYDDLRRFTITEKKPVCNGYEERYLLILWRICAEVHGTLQKRVQKNSRESRGGCHPF